MHCHFQTAYLMYSAVKIWNYSVLMALFAMSDEQLKLWKNLLYIFSYL